MTKTTNPTPRTRRAASSPDVEASAPKATKQARMIELLQRDQGASLSELAETLSWLPHTTRAALTGLRKKGQTIASQKVGGERRYRIEAAA